VRKGRISAQAHFRAAKVKAVRPAEAKMRFTLETSMCEKRPHFGAGSLSRSESEGRQAGRSQNALYARNIDV
jgi:hypothetical protein